LLKEIPKLNSQHWHILRRLDRAPLVLFHVGISLGILGCRQQAVLRNTFFSGLKKLFMAWKYDKYYRNSGDLPLLRAVMLKLIKLNALIRHGTGTSTYMSL